MISPTATQSPDILKSLVELNTSVCHLPEETQSTVAATEEVGKWFKEQGAQVHYTEEMEYPPNSGKMHKGMIAVFYPEGWDRTKENQDALAFSAHIDVVPAQWKSDAFSLREEGDKLIGRGAVDIKGPLASVMAAMNAAKDDIKAGKKPVMLMLSSCEEVGAKGAEDVCKLAIQHHLHPSEVVVVEPTDGLLGLGSKGNTENYIEFTAPKNTSPSHRYTKALQITLENQGGHVSLLGGTPLDPVKNAVAIFDAVKSLRERGFNLEICKAEIGSATNVITGYSTLTIGYHNAEDAPVIERELTKAVKNIESKANHGYKTFMAETLLGDHLVNRKLGRDFGIKFGDVKFTLKPLKNPVGLVSADKNNAVETALEVAEHIYAQHAQYREKKIPSAPGYFQEGFGFPNMTVIAVNGDSSHAELVNDNRSTSLVGNFELRYKTQALVRTSKGDMEVHINEISNLPSFNVNKDRHKDTLDAYRDLMKLAGFHRLKWTESVMPYSSDGGFIQQYFKDACVILASQGGLRNTPHAENESIDLESMKRNDAFYEAVIKRRAVNPELEMTERSKSRLQI